MVDGPALFDDGAGGANDPTHPVFPNGGGTGTVPPGPTQTNTGHRTRAMGFLDHQDLSFAFCSVLFVSFFGGVNAFLI